MFTTNPLIWVILGPDSEIHLKKPSQVLLRLIGEGVPQAERICWLVKLALDCELLTAVVKAENFVGQVQTRDNELQTAAQPDGSLGINLSVSVKICVTMRTLDPKWWFGNRSIIILVLESIAEDVRIIVRNTDANRQAGAIVCGTDVPTVRSLTL